MTSEPRRLHPAEVVFAALDALRELLVPIVIGTLIGAGGGSGRGLLFGALVAAAGVALAVVRWRATTYAVTDADVVFRSGVLSPDETIVPIPRIGSVDVVQGPLQRAFGVVEVQVHVAGGGGKPEIRLRAVSRDDARAIRQALGHPSAPQAPPLWRLRPARLLVAALTAPQIGLLLPIAGAAGALLQPLVESGEGGRLLDRAPDTAGGLLTAAAVVLLAAWTLSVLSAVVAFAGFELRVDGDRLRIRRGLLRRRAASLPLDRIHAVRLVESPIRQPLGLVAVRLETAGYRDEPLATRTLVPLASRAEAAEVLGRVVPVLAASPGPLERPPRRALRRYVLPTALAGAAAGALLAAVAPGAWPAALALLAAGAAAGGLRHADAGWAFDGERLALRERRIGRVTLLARHAKLQRHAVRRTPFQRRAGLARLSVAVGSGAEAHVAQLEDAVAEALFARLRPGRPR